MDTEYTEALPMAQALHGVNDPMSSDSTALVQEVRLSISASVP